MSAKWLETLPSELRVGAFDIKIARMPAGWGTDEVDEKFAEWSDVTQTIKIRVDLNSPHVLIDCILHELFHAFWDIYGLGKRPAEEKVVHSFSQSLTQVFRDNPDFLRWLVKMNEKQVKETTSGGSSYS